jgi:HSP20 family protein
MEREPHRSDDVFSRMALDYFLNRRRQGSDPADASIQAVPINMYETEDDVVVVAPMPGVEADNIDIEIDGSTLRLRSELRGPGQQDRRYLTHEWTYGPYARTVELPIEVDGEHANASHGNGVLVVSLPKAARSRPVKVSLRKTGQFEGAHQGHSGHHADREELDPRTSQ